MVYFFYLINLLSLCAKESSKENLSAVIHLLVSKLGRYSPLSQLTLPSLRNRTLRSSMLTTENEN
jgi:hypothetical protein